MAYARMEKAPIEPKDVDAIVDYPPQHRGCKPGEKIVGLLLS
jgi:hypothetical protein